MASDELYQKGLKTRTQVLGTKYVEANLAVPPFRVSLHEGRILPRADCHIAPGRS
jgi:hypothetical protein